MTPITANKVFKEDNTRIQQYHLFNLIYVVSINNQCLWQKIHAKKYHKKIGKIQLNSKQNSFCSNVDNLK